MKKSLALILGFILIFTVLNSHGHAIERPEIQFDSRNWSVGYESREGDRFIRQYILDGQSTDNWSELITAELFYHFRDDITLEQFVNQVIIEISKQCAVLDWDILEQSETDIVYEWSIRLCPGFTDQGEVARAIRGRDGIHVLHYAYKSSTLPDEKRDQWAEILKQSKILSE